MLQHCLKISPLNDQQYQRDVMGFLAAGCGQEQEQKSKPLQVAVELETRYFSAVQRVSKRLENCRLQEQELNYFFKRTAGC